MRELPCPIQKKDPFASKFTMSVYLLFKTFFNTLHIGNLLLKKVAYDTETSHSFLIVGL